MFFASQNTYCIPQNRPFETDVQDGLAYTPADMAHLSMQNRSVKMQELAPYMYSDDLPNDAPVPRELQRGVDENILWNEAGQAEARMNNAINEHGQALKRKRAES